MHVSDQFSWLLRFGLQNKKTTGKFLVAGLKKSGKTTFLWNLAESPCMSGALMAISRCGSETLKKGNVEFTTLEVGGGELGPGDELRTQIMCGSLAVIFLVDVTDATGFDLAAAELHALAASNELKGVPMVVFGNKATEGLEDILGPPAMTPQILRQHLHIDQISHTNRPIRVFLCSIAERRGYGDGFIWLATKVAQI